MFASETSTTTLSMLAQPLVLPCTYHVPLAAGWINAVLSLGELFSMSLNSSSLDHCHALTSPVPEAVRVKLAMGPQ